MQRRAASTLLPSCLYGFSALQTPSKVSASFVKDAQGA